MRCEQVGGTPMQAITRRVKTPQPASSIAEPWLVARRAPPSSAERVLSPNTPRYLRLLLHPRLSARLVDWCSLRTTILFTLPFVEALSDCDETIYSAR